MAALSNVSVKRVVSDTESLSVHVTQGVLVTDFDLRVLHLLNRKFWRNWGLIRVLLFIHHGVACHFKTYIIYKF